MSKLSEEEIIKIIKEYLSKEYIECTKIGAVSIPNEEWYAIQALLDLYNKEKEKNKIIADDIKKFKVEAYILGKTEENETMKGVIKRHYIGKDKIRELKKFYIKDCENKDITLVPLENLVKNINILLEEE